MNKQELNRALSHIHASDNLKQEVLTMKSKSKPNFRLIAKRAAVCAAVLIIMLSVMLWRNLFDNVYTEQNVLNRNLESISPFSSRSLATLFIFAL